MTSAPVFLADQGHLESAGPGSRYTLAGTEARHAGVVQRRRVGERVDVVDGAGVRLQCVIAEVEPSRLVLDVVERVVEPAPAVRIVLVQALAKGDRDELAIEAATEVGVDEVVPWQAERSVVVWRGERAAKSRAKWLATVRQATKQSRRAHLPVVADAVDGRGLVRRVHAVLDTGGMVLVLHEAADLGMGAVPISSSVLQSVQAGAHGQTSGQVMLVVGPEGGISAGELAALTDAGALAVRLGPHVLRTSTAGPVAVALVADRLGRWT